MFTPGGMPASGPGAQLAGAGDASAPAADGAPLPVDPGRGAPPTDTDAPAGADLGAPPKPDAGGGVVSQQGTVDPTCGAGKIFGLICSTADQEFVNGATVWVDTTDCTGTPIIRLTTSDGGGYYTLEDVPSGLQTVHVERDGFQKTYTVQVESGKLTDVTSVAHKECFKATVGTCVAGAQNLHVEAKSVSGLADIVWFIDTSGSMKQEATWTQGNLNSFAQFIAGAQIDLHVVLVADGFDLCVPPPLAGPACADSPIFRHVKVQVGSTNGLEKLIEAYPQYQDFLRPGATTNFVAVTDDNSKKSASWFTTQVKAQQNPGFSDPFVFHSIVGMGTFPVTGCLGAAFGGVEYLALSQQTGGATFPVCNTDWSSIFSEIAQAVVETVQPVCLYPLPNPGPLADADASTLYYGGAVVPQVTGLGSCGGAPGWYYDVPSAPTSLGLCPATCSALKGGVLQLFWSCD